MILNRANSQIFMKLMRFSLVGISGTVINILIFNLLVHVEFIKLNYLLANMIAFCIAASNNFYWNNVWTFKGHAAQKCLKIKYIQYVMISGFNLMLNTAMVYVFVRYLNFPVSLANILAIGFCFLFNFIGNYFVTFRTLSSSKIVPSQNGSSCCPSVGRVNDNNAMQNSTT